MVNVGFRIAGFGLRVQGLGGRVQGLVYGIWFSVSDVGCRV